MLVNLNYFFNNMQAKHALQNITQHRYSIAAKADEKEFDVWHKQQRAVFSIFSRDLISDFFL